jgi:hypothetical protein
MTFQWVSSNMLCSYIGGARWRTHQKGFRAAVLDGRVVASCFAEGMSELQGIAGVAKGPSRCGDFQKQPGWQQFGTGSPLTV